MFTRSTVPTNTYNSSQERGNIAKGPDNPAAQGEPAPNKIAPGANGWRGAPPVHTVDQDGVHALQLVGEGATGGASLIHHLRVVAVAAAEVILWAEIVTLIALESLRGMSHF